MNTNADPEHAPRCADCNVTMEYDDDRDDEGNLLNAWWHCPSCLRNESFCHATDAPPAPTRQYYYRVDGCLAFTPNSPACICWHDEGTGPLAGNERLANEWRNKPAPTPPADAPEPPRDQVCPHGTRWPHECKECQEPPWDKALRELFFLDPTLANLASRKVAIIRTACEAHAAALAQERDALRQQILEANTRWEAAYSERETLRATVAHLTAERDRLLAQIERLTAERK